MTAGTKQPAEPLVEPLTRREQQVLRLLAEGYSGPEIAEQLTLALSTVREHLQNIYGKLGADGKRQAINRARELGLVKAPAALELGTVHEVSAASATLAPQPARKHNLPVQVTRYFGRENDIAQLKDRIQQERLVTLTGSGGVGKTRLSLQAAEALLPEFSDRVWFIALAPLTNPALVAQTVATTLGLRDEPGRPVVETLLDYLRPRQALLVLDNCEHLLDACAQLADSVLRACPRVTVLASSREPLGIMGEAVLAVPSLAFPAAGRAVVAERLADFAAVRLFLDRVGLVVPSFAVTPDNASAVARICQRLDGIPLALEMAAARLSVLSAEQLAGRLDDAFRVLTGGSHTALPQHQTLRATLDWSYKLLSEPERLLLQRLSIFAGGCTLEAAEAVCAGEGLGAGEVLERLAALAAKSMVIAVRSPGQAVRYQLLETVRQYAREKLKDPGEVAGLRARHRDYILSQTESARQAEVGSAAARESWARLGVELDNLRLALEWSLHDEANIEAAPRLALGAVNLWPTFRETLDWSNKVLAWCDAHLQLPGHLRVDVICGLSGPIAMDKPDLQLELLAQAAAISRGLGPTFKPLLLDALICQSYAYFQAGDGDRAAPVIAEVEALVTELEADPAAPTLDVRLWANIAEAKSVGAFDQGLYYESIAYANEAIQRYQAVGWAGEIHYPLISRAKSRVRVGDYALAREDLLKAAELISQVGYMAYNTRWLAETAWRLGNPALARQELLDSLRMAEAVPDYNIVASNVALAGMMSAATSQPVRAATLAGAAQAMYARQHRKAWEDSSLDSLLPGWRDGPEQAAIQAAYAAGQAMTNDEAVAYALSDEPA
jgi:non-specific serine/threonine protein kinase